MAYWWDLVYALNVSLSEKSFHLSLYIFLCNSEPSYIKKLRDLKKSYSVNIQQMDGTIFHAYLKKFIKACPIDKAKFIISIIIKWMVTIKGQFNIYSQ